MSRPSTLPRKFREESLSGQESHAGALDPEDVARVHVPHDRELEEMPRLRIDVGADVQEHGEALEVREHRGDRGAVHAAEHAHHEHRDRHGGAGVAGGDERAGLAVAHHLGGDAEGRVALAAERLRRALAHADDLGRMADVDAGRRPDAGQLPLDGSLVPDEHHRGAELLDRRHRALDHHRGAVVASHGVNGDLHYAPSTATISRPL
jgi:hypothetical protein